MSGIVYFIVVIVLVVIALAFSLRTGYAETPENPNANNPDAFEADLDP